MTEVLLCSQCKNPTDTPFGLCSKCREINTIDGIKTGTIIDVTINKVEETLLSEPIKAVDNRNPDGTFGANNNANPLGRPKGQSLKEYDRESFAKMTPEKKEEFLKTISPEIRYRMAEGNPAQAQDVTSGGKTINIGWMK